MEDERAARGRGLGDGRRTDERRLSWSLSSRASEASTEDEGSERRQKDSRRDWWPEVGRVGGGGGGGGEVVAEDAA